MTWLYQIMTIKYDTFWMRSSKSEALNRVIKKINRKDLLYIR